MGNEASFLGTGWSFPPSFTHGGREVETVSGPEDVHQSLQILLGCQRGERVLEDEFGCDLGEFVFEDVDQGLVNRLVGMISDAILYHEPRIRLDGVEVSPSDAEQGLLLINIRYTIRSTNSRYNMVYPFHLRGGRAPGS